MLTYVLAQCDLPQLDNEILYMMELLDPSLLQGEGSSTVAQQERSVGPRRTVVLVTLGLLSVQVATT